MEQSVEERKAAGLERKKVKQLIREGAESLGSMDQYLFREAALKKINSDLPTLLSDFELQGAKALLGSSLEALTDYMATCFADYEAEIDRLNSCVRRLKRENKALRDGDFVAAATKGISEGRSTTLGEWKEWTLRSKSKAMAAAIKKEAKGDDLKAIALAAEVLRRLEKGVDSHTKTSLVNAEIVGGLKLFYATVSYMKCVLPPPPPPPPYPPPFPPDVSPRSGWRKVLFFFLFLTLIPLPPPRCSCAQNTRGNIRSTIVARGQL
jgi:hypothetical protein